MHRGDTRRSAVGIPVHASHPTSRAYVHTLDSVRADVRWSYVSIDTDLLPGSLPRDSRLHSTLSSQDFEMIVRAYVYKRVQLRHLDII